MLATNRVLGRRVQPQTRGQSSQATLPTAQIGIYNKTTQRHSHPSGYEASRDNSSSGALNGTGPPWRITLARTGSRLEGKRVGRRVLRAAPSVCGVPLLPGGDERQTSLFLWRSPRLPGSSRAWGKSVNGEGEGQGGGGVLLFGSRGGTNVWITLKDPEEDTSPVPSGEVGM